MATGIQLYNKKIYTVSSAEPLHAMTQESNAKMEILNVSFSAQY
jgi:hypothetical protein